MKIYVVTYLTGYVLRQPSVFVDETKAIGHIRSEYEGALKEEATGLSGLLGCESEWCITPNGGYASIDSVVGEPLSWFLSVFEVTAESADMIEADIPDMPLDNVQYSLNEEESVIPYERMKRIAQLLLVGLLIDGKEEGFTYMDDSVGISAEEATILLSDSGEFREEEYAVYLQEAV